MIREIGGAILGMGLGAINDARQRKQQKQFQKEQIAGAKELSDYEKGNQMDMWNKTNYGAQKKHMEEAGLNPGLMYGMGGGGGVTTGGGSGAMPTSGVAEGSSQGVKAAMDIAMMKAQKAVLETQADKNRAEADKTRGIDTQEAGERIKGLGYKNEITNATVNAEIKRIQFESENELEKLAQARNKTNISNETYKEEIKQIKTETALREIEVIAKGKGIELTEAQIKNIDELIKQNWESLRIKNNEAGIKEFEAGMRAQQPSIMNVIGGELRRTINNINTMTGAGDGGYYRYKGK